MSHAPNNRIFYACQAVGFGTYDQNQDTPDPLVAAHGVQSVGINTTFNLEQAFELGQISIYENIEGLPDVEVTVEKVLDGYPLLYHLATSGVNFATSPTFSLVERAKERCNVALGIYPDDEVAVSGAAKVEVFMSGMYINSLNYTLPTDGNFTESITLVGNSKRWYTSPIAWNSSNSNMAPSFKYGGDFPIGSGGIQRRENVVMSSSVIPVSIYDVSQTGYYTFLSTGSIDSMRGNNWNSTDTNRPMNRPRAHIQNITISTDFGREDILELGHKEPYYRSAAFPVEVTSEFEVIAISGDFINVYSNGNSTSVEPILIVLTDGTTFNLGGNNRLSSVNYTGGDAGGGNATITYSFSTFNDLWVTGPTAFNQ
jgi:hypothetical protein